MTSKTVKFEISLKELVVKFEGDIQLAEKVQGEVTGALNTLASAQQRMLGPAKAAPTPVASPPSPTRKSSRRKRQATSQGIDPTIVDGLPDPNGNGNGDVEIIDVTESRRPRRSGAGTADLITELKNEGLFVEKRTNASIREALARKGHSFKSNEINPVLVRLTQQGSLKRDKNGDDQWVYFSE